MRPSRRFQTGFALLALAGLGWIATAEDQVEDAPVPGPRPNLFNHSLELQMFNVLLTMRGQSVDVVFSGDSILAGLRLPDLWPETTAVNRSIGGDDSTNLRFRFAADVLALRPRHAVICIGTNDFWWNPVEGEAPDPRAAVELLVRNVAAIEDMCDEAGVELTVCSLLPVNPKLEWGSWRQPWVAADAHVRANERLAAYCASNGVRFLDLYTRFVDTHGYFTKHFTIDGVHPNVAAQMIIVDRIRSAINGTAPAPG